MRGDVRGGGGEGGVGGLGVVEVGGRVEGLRGGGVEGGGGMGVVCMQTVGSEGGWWAA